MLIAGELPLLRESSPVSICDVGVLDTLLDEVHVIRDTSEFDGQCRDVENRVGHVGIAVAWLTDAAGVHDDSLLEDFRVLNVRVPENEDVLAAEQLWVER
jgi:hypothetical protein